MKKPRFYVSTRAKGLSGRRETAYDQLEFAQGHADNYLRSITEEHISGSATIRVVFEEKVQ